MGIPIVDGRDFSLADVTGAPVVLVNETLAKTFFKGQSPVGRRLKPGFSEQRPWFNIVGVVKDVKQGGLSSKTGRSCISLRSRRRRSNRITPRNMNIVVRSDLPLDALAPQIRRVVQSMDSTLPIVRLRTMEDVFGASVSRPRLLAQLSGDLRRSGAASGRHRHLWHPRLHGDRAEEGDRHPHGARGHARQRARQSPRSGNAADRCRPRRSGSSPHSG